MKTSRLEQLLSRFSDIRIAVLGDFFLDLYIELDRSLSELSLETGKEAFQAVNLRGLPGAAGVVTSNLRALGIATSAVGYVGMDGHGHTLGTALAATGVDLNHLHQTPDRFTPTYIKPLMKELSGSTHELNRLDVINRTPNAKQLNEQLNESLQQLMGVCDGVLVLEQVRRDGCGVLSPPLRDTLTAFARQSRSKPVVVDSRHFPDRYPGTSLKLNLTEAARCFEGESAPDLSSSQDLEAVRHFSQRLYERQRSPVYLTLGRRGLCVSAAEGFAHFPGVELHGPIDVVGAGDSVLAGIGAARCAGATPSEAAYIGNLIGSIVVQQLGTTGTADRAEILKQHSIYQAQRNLPYDDR